MSGAASSGGPSDIATLRSIVAEDLFATLATTEGDIRVQLFPNHAPKTVANFVDLAEGTREWTDPRTGTRGKVPLYDGTIFHRVISGFMIQGGDPLGTGTGGPGYRFNDEIHPELAFTKPYLLAMANAGPGTNGSQFFITVAATQWLTGKHTIFGEVADADSRAVVDRITAVATGQMDRPAKDVVLTKVSFERVAS
jgi:peptidyl-prolyl cis-trans isomerase A (cyclophilin A)